ncbi:hypothetical protein TNCV_2238341 [Trichonephila clavipes]|nr:hypothetical protein TNCV_2238341 [Trichonephila clavipes]
MAASSKTPPHQSNGPQKFNTPLQVPVFPESSLLCHHTNSEKPSDTTSSHSVLKTEINKPEVSVDALEELLEHIKIYSEDLNAINTEIENAVDITELDNELKKRYRIPRQNNNMDISSRKENTGAIKKQFNGNFHNIESST